MGGEKKFATPGTTPERHATPAVREPGSPRESGCSLDEEVDVASEDGKPGTIEGEAKCPGCEKVFRAQIKLNEKFVVIMGQSVACPRCGYTFPFSDWRKS